jgi:glycosyltransferase involved in cell wall biosynthesis
VKVLSIATLYPNASQPVHAVFVEQRLRAMAKRFPVTVICPIPWFPLTGRLRRYRHRAAIPRRETRHGIDVRYPRFLSFPLVLKPLDGVFLFLTCWLEARRLRATFPFDRLDAHLAFPDGWGAVLLGRLLRMPVAVTLRGHDVNDLPRYPVRRRQVAWALRNADAVFAVADALREGAIELGADPGRTFTVGNGVDTERFRPRDRAEARRRVGLPEEDDLVLSVGHLVERKGFHHLVRAWPRVREARPGARLVIVGAAGEEGDFTAGIRRAIAEAGVADCVQLAGAVSHEELGPWYGAADLFCLASAKEGRANVLLEALASGTPVVATDVWGTSEVVSGDDVGILVRDVAPETLAAAIVEALGREWNRDAISARASRFSWEGAAARVEDVLRSPASPTGEGGSVG